MTALHALSAAPEGERQFEEACYREVAAMKSIVGAMGRAPILEEAS
jgi:hypothetical protein